MKILLWPHRLVGGENLPYSEHGNPEGHKAEELFETWHPMQTVVGDVPTWFLINMARSQCLWSPTTPSSISGLSGSVYTVDASLAMNSQGA